MKSRSFEYRRKKAILLRRTLCCNGLFSYLTGESVVRVLNSSVIAATIVISHALLRTVEHFQHELKIVSVKILGFLGNGCP